ncbi:MAG TPA: PVC-type heme-binding CxxCH protein, partial [Pirellulales bacterium]|nr:PVC-type heme-binding CxxCH protein [Pirellulales bacterium]
MPHRPCHALTFVAGFLVAALFAEGRAAEPAASTKVHSPLATDEAVKRFVLAEGFKIELVAAEPDIADPVAARFDEDGRLWVVEMRDYPEGWPEGPAPRSRIVMLEDLDNDGRYETSHVFADKLLFATGVQPWKRGIIATVAGKIVYMKDTDGDGRADVMENWFEGFAQENPQLRANHPRFALDNRVYVATGLKGGAAESKRTPGADAVPLRSRDFRFDPLGTMAEAITGPGQFGVTFDDYGNRFEVSNRNPLFQLVLADRYLERNPLFAVTDVKQDVAASGDASRVFAISQSWTTSILHAGQFTAACGTDIYRGDALAGCYGNSFTCEPTGNLVHREVLSPAGATFV